MTGLLITLVVLQSLSLLIQIGHYGSAQRLLNLALGSATVTNITNISKGRPRG